VKFGVASPAVEEPVANAGDGARPASTIAAKAADIRRGRNAITACRQATDCQDRLAEMEA